MHRFLTNLVLTAVLGISTAALADVPKPGAPRAQSHTDQLFDQAAAAFDAGRYGEAEAKLKQVWALKQTYDVAGNLGVVEVKLGKYPQGAQHLAWALDHFPLTEPAKARRGFEQELEKARARSGALRIQVSVDGAEVSVDGRSVGRSPVAAEVFVEPGAHAVAAMLPGFDPAQLTVTVDKGGARSATLALAPVQPPPGPNQIVLATGGAAAGLGVVLGAVFAGVSASRASSAASQRAALMKGETPVMCGTGAQASPACADVAGAANAQRTFANASFWSFAGGGAVGAATLVYWLATPKGAAPAKLGMRVVPAVGPQGGSLELRGTW